MVIALICHEAEEKEKKKKGKKKGETEGKRAESLGQRFDSLQVDDVLAPWLIHWLAHLQLARDTAIRHSVMSQCYKYSHAFPTTFLPSRNCLSPERRVSPRPCLRAILSPSTELCIYRVSRHCCTDRTRDFTQLHALFFKI